MEIDLHDDPVFALHHGDQGLALFVRLGPVLLVCLSLPLSLSLTILLVLPIRATRAAAQTCRAAKSAAARAAAAQLPQNGILLIRGQVAEHLSFVGGRSRCHLCGGSRQRGDQARPQKQCSQQCERTLNPEHQSPFCWRHLRTYSGAAPQATARLYCSLRRLVV